MKVVGLMSGTSLDGMDAALLEVEGEDPAGFAWELLGFACRPYSDEQRAEIRAGVEGGNPRRLALLHVRLGAWAADAVEAVCRQAAAALDEVAAVGSHGQTIWHEPPGGGSGPAVSFQLGDPAVLAERTGCTVVSDFRARDVAAGGHGAPLVPFADRLLFSVPDRARALQNLGGMGNVTWLPPAGAPEELVAFDTGPGVALLDAAAERATNGRLRYDDGGRMAERGRVDEALLARLLEHEFLHTPPPRTTGRETFGSGYVEALVRETEPGAREGGWDDLLATLTAFTARSVAEAYRRWVVPRGVDEVFLTGGGARNPALAGALRRELAPLEVRPAGELGLDPDAREAAAFAVLAWAHLQGVPGNVPAATGARGPRVLGSRTPGRKAR